MQRIKKPAWGEQAMISKEPAPNDEAKSYLRIGCTYYKIVDNPDTGKYLKRWTKAAIILDHGSRCFNAIPKFDDADFLPNELKELDIK